MWKWHALATVIFLTVSTAELGSLPDLARPVSLLADHQQLGTTTTRLQKKRFLRFLEDQQGGGENDASDWYETESTTVKYDSCSTNDKGTDMVKFHLCAATCAKNTIYATNMKVFLRSFFGTTSYNEDEDQDAADDGDDDYGGAVQKSDSFAPSLYVNCAAFDEKFYVGPYCQDNQIYLGYYWDEDCTRLLDDSTFYGLYSVALEYSVLSGYSLVNQTTSGAPCSSVDVDDNAEEEERDDNEERRDYSGCSALLSYSSRLSTVKVEVQKWTQNESIILAVAALVATMVLVMIILMGTVYTCRPESSWLSKSKKKQEPPSPSPTGDGNVVLPIPSTSSTWTIEKEEALLPTPNKAAPSVMASPLQTKEDDVLLRTLSTSSTWKDEALKAAPNASPLQTKEKCGVLRTSPTSSTWRVEEALLPPSPREAPTAMASPLPTKEDYVLLRTSSTSSTWKVEKEEALLSTPLKVTPSASPLSTKEKYHVLRTCSTSSTWRVEEALLPSSPREAPTTMATPLPRNEDCALLRTSSTSSSTSRVGFTKGRHQESQ